MVETGGRLGAKSLRSLKELVGGAVREQMTRGSLEKGWVIFWVEVAAMVAILVCL